MLGHKLVQRLGAHDLFLCAKSATRPIHFSTDFGLGIDLVRDDKFHMDRRLDGARFHAQTGFSAPDWESMIAELRADPTPYDE
jgi:hypothetical protein